MKGKGNFKDRKYNRKYRVLILVKRYMLLVPPTTTLKGSFWKQEVKTRKRSDLEYNKTWRNHVIFISIEIVIKVYNCGDLLDF